MDKTRIRDAASVILLRKNAGEPCVLMGQRGSSAAFMPNKFVFPGGALDSTDRDVPLVSGLSERCMNRLREDADPTLAQALVLAAIREVWEETGLLLGQPDASARAVSADMPQDWQSFFQHGVVPSGAGMRFVFRAITPPGRPRRFDARFFLIDADHVVGDPDDFSQACEELSHLQWIPLAKARSFDLPFITEVVLAEIGASLETPDDSARVPYFFNAEGRSHFRRL